MTQARRLALYRVLISCMLFMILSAACMPAPAVTVPSGPQSWIDAPLPNATLPLAPVEIIGHANHPEGVISYEVSVNGQVVQTSQLSQDQAGKPLAYLSNSWNPSAPGTYVIGIRSAGPDGSMGDAAEVRIQIGMPPTATSTPAALITPDYGFSPTPTPDFVLADPIFSSDIFYFEGDSCGPKELTIQAMASDPQIWSVVLFFRLADPDSAERTSWTSLAMDPLGNGQFRKTLRSQVDIPGFATYINSILQVQLVATDNQGGEIARTAVFSNVQLQPCN